MKPVGLSRQIVLSMVALAFGVVLFLILTSYAVFYLADKYWPETITETSEWEVTDVEWVWMILTTVVALVLAAVVALHLARRILVPLNSLANSIRLVANGDLSARADAGDRSLGEASALADDFNALASQLQRMTHERSFWNAAIAHELRTPVTILRGRLQGLAEGVFEPEESLFRSLLAQVEGLSRLIEDLRAVSLAENGHLDLHIQETDLSTEVASVVDFCTHALQASGHRPELDLQAGAVLCDPVRIRQALLALLENVRRHAVPGVVTIKTRLEDEWSILQVEDEGPGIPKEFASQVFTAFRRLQRNDSKDTGSSGGSGLGLAVAAAIAQAHGGRASCHPTAAGGSCFELRWPSPRSASDKTADS